MVRWMESSTNILCRRFLTDSMGLVGFVGYTLICFSPTFAAFVTFVAPDPLKVIIYVASAFVWLLALFLSSLLWFAVVPLRDVLAFSLVFSVLIQESMRVALYRLMRKGIDELNKLVGVERFTGGSDVVTNRHAMAFVCGFGFGTVSCCFHVINALSALAGPAGYSIKDPRFQLPIVTVLLGLMFVFHHTCWSIIMFDALHRSSSALERKRMPWWMQLAFVYILHLVASCLLFINSAPGYWFIAAIVLNGALVIAEMIWCVAIVFHFRHGDELQPPAVGVLHFVQSLVSRRVFWKTIFSRQTLGQTQNCRSIASASAIHVTAS